jgi:hypothetical protein
VGVRPVLIPSREEDPPQRVGFGDRVLLSVPGHGGAIKVENDNLYMAIALRNGGTGLAVIHGWRVEVMARPAPDMPRPDPERFRRQMLDLYIPAGDIGFWLGAIRDRNDPEYEHVRSAAENGQRVMVDLLYGDYEGRQRTITRFGVSPWPEIEGERAEVIRYWNVDRDDPR